MWVLKHSLIKWRKVPEKPEHALCSRVVSVAVNSLTVYTVPKEGEGRWSHAL